MKRILLTLLMSSVAFCIFAMGFEADGMLFSVMPDDPQGVVLSQGPYVEEPCNVTIPDEVVYNDVAYKVKGVASYAFYMASIDTLPSGTNVAFIDGEAFPIATLRHINVNQENPAFVSQDGALYTSGFASLVLYPNMKEDKLLTLPSSTTEILAGACGDCRSLEKVVLPEGLRVIGDRAFDGVVNLSELNLPSTLEDVGIEVFDWRSPWYKALPDGPLYCGNHVLWLYKGTPEGGIIDVADDCLAIATGFKFSGKANTMHIPESVMKIGMVCYNNLMDFDVAIDNPAYRSLDGVLLDKDGSRLERFPCGRDGKYVVPQGVRTIGTHAFAKAFSLTRITLPEGVESIEDYAFYYCLSLERIDLPTTLTHIGESAFEIVTAVPLDGAPQKAYNDGIYCLGDVYCRATVLPEADCNAFNCDNLFESKLYVPVGAAEAYRAAAPWNEFDEIIEIDFADVNGDGVVSGADVTALYNNLLDGTEVEGISDINGDGIVNGADVTALYNLLLN